MVEQIGAWTPEKVKERLQARQGYEIPPKMELHICQAVCPKIPEPKLFSLSVDWKATGKKLEPDPRHTPKDVDDGVRTTAGHKDAIEYARIEVMSIESCQSRVDTTQI